MSDLIDRQQAIDALDEIEAEVADGYGYKYAKWREYFVEMPSAQPAPSQVAKDIARIVENGQDMRVIAQPERKKGKWIHHPEWEDDGECGYECSECHMGSDVDYNFCMRCGADMREVTT